MNTKGLEAMVPKMIDEAEEYFREWGNEGEVRRTQRRLVAWATPSAPRHVACRCPSNETATKPQRNRNETATRNHRITKRRHGRAPETSLQL